MSARNIILLLAGAIMILAEFASAEDCILQGSNSNHLSYTTITALGGAAGSIRNRGALEERVTQLESIYTAVFNCPPTTPVNLDVIAQTISAPNFNGVSDNLDLIATDMTGVTHLVDVRVNGFYLATNIPANRLSTMVVNSMLNGLLAPNASGILEVVVISTYTLTGGAEELGAGYYESQFDIRVSPENSMDTVINIITISGIVHQECSVDIQSQFSQSGTVPYIKTLQGFRTGMLQASDSVTFDCNSNSFSYSVDLTALSAPDFINAENIDLVNNSATDIGVDHKVGVIMKYPVGGFSDQIVKDVTSNSELDLVTVSASSVPMLDRNGDVEIEVASRFETINTAEELAAGIYSAQMTVTVTAQ